MKMRVLSSVCALAILISIFVVSVVDVKASDNVLVDGSYLTNEDSSVGNTYSEAVTRGKHLMDGECSITKAGRGRIYVYASTTANHDVDYLSTVLYVDRYNEETGKWGQIDFWQVENVNTYYVSTSKTLVVDRGYYYRVRATHVAGMDVDYPYDEATTATDGIWLD